MMTALVKSIDLIKNGGWYIDDVPDKTHDEEVDDICGECGHNFGKTTITIVDSYRKVRKYQPPLGEHGADMIIMHPEMEKKLLKKKGKIYEK